MMQRIIPPACSCCEARAEYDSLRWPTLRLCFQCIKRFKDLCIQKKLADRNPLFFELVEGLGDTEVIRMHDGTERLKLWGASPDDPMASRLHWIELPLDRL